MKIIKWLFKKLHIRNRNLAVWNLSLTLEVVVLIHWTIRLGVLSHFEDHSYRLKYSNYIALVLIVWAVIVSPIKFYLLWTGITEKNMSRLETYSWVNIITAIPVNTPLTMYFRIGGWIYGPYTIWKTLEIIIFILGLVIVTYHVYYYVPSQLRQLHLDKVAIKKLKEQMEIKGQLVLHGEELQNENCTEKNVANSSIDVCMKQWLIRSWDICIDKNLKIGEGQFGSVYKGKLVTKGGLTREIAAKLSTTTSKVDLEMICSEIKINLWVGRHMNVVEFFGVCSDPSGSYFLISEYCEGGNLKDYLNRLHPIYSKLSPKTLGNFSSMHKYVNQQEIDSELVKLEVFRFLEALLRISIEICAGMEHLASKKIVHGDCATRNVLLSGMLEAKISDFGMSQKLYNYQLYCQNMQQDLMPWRWMSIECLEDLKFSEKSDVWAFGVVLWEIFSFGKIPFGDVGWSLNFPTELRHGEQSLEQPEFCDDEIFKIMVNCWAAEPSKRPNFAGLRNDLASIGKVWDN